MGEVRVKRCPKCGHTIEIDKRAIRVLKRGSKDCTEPMVDEPTAIRRGEPMREG